MIKIVNLRAYEIIASGGTPTVEAELAYTFYINGQQINDVITSSISFGASAGSKEAKVIFDGDNSRFMGMGMAKVCQNINLILADSFKNKELLNLKQADDLMIKLDSTKDKSRLGGNAILPVSMVIAKAFARSEGLELYEYLHKIFKGSDVYSTIELQLNPMMVMIEGGKHADKSSDFQEYCISYLDDNANPFEKIRVCEEVYMHLKQLMKARGFSTNVGNEGAFAPNNLSSNATPLELLTEAIRLSGHEEQVGISLDIAASEFRVSAPNGMAYLLKTEGMVLTSPLLLNLYEDLIKKYKIVSIEDPFAEDDMGAWKSGYKRLLELNQPLKVITDDLTVTNPGILDYAIKENLGNMILIKPNQIGTITETIECCKMAKEHGWGLTVSHRGGGESNDDFITDLAIAVGAKWIKCGPTRGERVSKYNRLIRIMQARI